MGSDIIRAIRWKNKNSSCDSQLAFERSLELFDLTVSDPKNRRRLKEVLRAREAWVDFFVYDNEYNTTQTFWENYFNDFNYAAALQRGR